MLPENYNFELVKTLNRIKSINAKKVNIQMPDGLLKYATTIINYLENNSNCKCVILGDVVYGACNISDYDCDLLIHYGHSCLIPIYDMLVSVLYIFVDVVFDTTHLVKIIKNLLLENNKIAIVGTIQFNSCVNLVGKNLNLEIPCIKPLSKGELLGCTSPLIESDTVVYIGDGRFHLESAMIQNPNKKYYKYCPFTKKMTREYYDYIKMIKIREENIVKFNSCKNIGIILGKLGRQGNYKILKNLEEKLKDKNIFRIALEEINDKTLDLFTFCEAFVQISCPRLSIDWGYNKKPLLSPFEVFYNKKEYLMDNYSKESKLWNNF